MNIVEQSTVVNDVSWAPSRFAPEHSSSNATSPLFGRQTERALVADLFDRPDVRLVTLTGPGGVGKTRLARQLLLDLSDRFPDGVAIVQLASLAEPEHVLTTTATLFGLPVTTSEALLASVAREIDDRQMLLVFDNFEHVVAAAPLASALLEACPRLDILATSRIALRLSTEFEVAIAPLPLPSLESRATLGDIAANPAVALFMRRAQAIQPAIRLAEANAPVIASICARLDGLPLAIELAAARIKVLPPAALLQRLDNRLDLLTTGPRDLPARQRTMRDAIAWSHDLLAPDERALFRRFAVFAGGATFEAAEVICGPDILDTLSALIDHSLIQRVDDVGGDAHFVMLETIREFALGELAGSDDELIVRRRHSEWCLGLADTAFKFDHGLSDRAWIAMLDREMDNVRSALTWLLTGGPKEIERGLLIISALWSSWHSRPRHEGRLWLAQFLASPHIADVALAAVAVAWSTKGELEMFSFDQAEAEISLNRALTIAR